MTQVDKIKFSINDVIKLISYTVVICVAWFNMNSKLDGIDVKINELKIYKTTEHDLFNKRLDKLEITADHNRNKTNEIERNVIRLMAVIPNYKLKIENEN